MKNIVGHTTFWFIDGHGQVNNFIFTFKPYANLLNRLLSEKYNGKKIRLIKLSFATEEVYQLYPKALKNHTDWYNGVLLYSNFFDLITFSDLSFDDQKQFLWRRAYEILQEAAIKTKNPALAVASEYAYHKGLAMGLNPDFKLFTTEVVLHGVALQASIQIRYDTPKMYSYFILEKEGNLIFEQFVDDNRVDFEIFFDFIKKIEVQDHTIVLKGQRDIEYLPLKIPISEEIIKQ